jgi:hypothetical protein
MNYQEPYRIHQINLSNIIYAKVKTTETKKLVFIKYEENKKMKPLVIQCPSLLNINQPTKVSNDYHELEIPLITQEKDKAKLLNKFFEDLDNKIINDAKYNSTLWFDGLKQKESIKYKRIIKESDNFLDGTIKIKIIKNIDFETMLQINNKNRINVKDIPTNYWCKILIEVYALVINYQTNTFSIFLRPIILSFKQKEIYNYKLLEDSDSEKEEMDVPDSELSSIFMKQIHKNVNEPEATSSQVKIIEPLLNNIKEESTSSSELFSSSSDKDKSTSDEDKSSSDENKSTSDKSKSTSDEEHTSITSEMINTISKEKVISENNTSSSEDKNSPNDEGKNNPSDEDKIILSDSSDEEKYLEKMQKIL